MVVPKKGPKQDGELSEQETAQWRDAVIKRMLDTSPQKHKDVPKKRKHKDDGART